MTEADVDEQRKSKSQIKREFIAFQALGKELVELSKKQLVKLPLSDSLREAVIEARPLKLSARNRQIKYIGSLMPEENVDEIRSTLEDLGRPYKQDTAVFHQLEQWRNRLLQGDQKLLQELVDKYEGFERQYINQLIRNAKKEQESNKPPKSARLLFKYLSDCQTNE